MKKLPSKIVIFILIIFSHSCYFNNVAPPQPTPSSSVYQPSPRLSTATPTINSPTPTIISTVSAVSAKALFSGLAIDNGGCRLPCLWGFNPGQTDKNKVETFTSVFPSIDIMDFFLKVYKFEQMGGISIIYIEKPVDIRLFLSYYFENGSIGQLSLHAEALFDYGITINDLKPTWSSIYDAPLYKKLRYYALPNILSLYGKPSQVLVATAYDGVDQFVVPDYFIFVLDYEKQGFYVEYIAPKETNATYFIGCPFVADVILSVFPDKGDLTLKDMLKIDSLYITTGNLDYFKSIENATDMTLDEFYKNYQDPNNLTCIKTPKDIWPAKYILPPTP